MKLRREISKFLALATLLVSTASNAAERWKEPEDFRGLRWGATPDEAKKFFPTVRFEFAIVTVGPIELFSGKNQQISDNLVVGFDLGFSSKRFAYAQMSFRADDFEIVKEIFVTRYGKPHNTTTNILTNAMGAQFRNISLIWNGPTVSIVINKYESASEGSAKISKRTFETEYQSAIKKETRDAAKGF